MNAAEFLVTPKTQQIITVGADYAIDKHTQLTADVAGSNYDINTLSTIEKNNDKGVAGKFTLKNTRPLNSTGLQLTSTVGYEYVQKNFTPVEPLRSVEFTRDWGLTLSTTPATEKIYTASFLLNDKRLNSLKYEIDRYERSDGFVGMRNALLGSQTIDSFHIIDQISLATSDSNNFAGHYLKPSIDVSRRLPFLKNYTLGRQLFAGRQREPGPESRYAHGNQLSLPYLDRLSQIPGEEAQPLGHVLCRPGQFVCKRPKYGTWRPQQNHQRLCRSPPKPA